MSVFEVNKEKVKGPSLAGRFKAESKNQVPGPGQYQEIFQDHKDLEIVSNHNRTKNIVFPKGERFRETLPISNIVGQSVDSRSYDLKAEKGKIISFPKNQRFREKTSDTPGSGTYNPPTFLDSVPGYVKSTLGKK
jgi:hypothetical protein